MTFDEAVELAREIDAACHVVCMLTCLYGGGMVGDTWSVNFRPHPHARGMQSASSYDEWAYWCSEAGIARLLATMPTVPTLVGDDKGRNE